MRVLWDIAEEFFVISTKHKIIICLVFACGVLCLELMLINICIGQMVHAVGLLSIGIIIFIHTRTVIQIFQIWERNKK